MVSGAVFLCVVAVAVLVGLVLGAWWESVTTNDAVDRLLDRFKMQ